MLAHRTSRASRVLADAAALLAAATVVAAPAGAQRTPSGSTPRGLHVPVDYYKLPNGLKVVLSTDATTPTTVVAVYYDIGFRTEPRDRTGFAHLFEHMMFQGSQNLGKLEFIKLIEQNGGVLNGSTRFDFTNYFEVVPSHALERVLWAEADRMRGLAIDSSNLQNQRDVVKNEVRVNVLNQPYGGFPWIDLPMRANTNWYNAHNFYGDFKDLDAATLADVQSFFKTYYAPNNAVLVIAGDFQPAQARAWVEKYFGSIASVPRPPKPDISEPPQTAERRSTRIDSLANRPAIGVAYHVPARWTPEWFAFGLLDQILAQGRDSRLYQELVQKRGLTGGVDAGINFGLGNMFDYQGPMLWEMQLFHDKDKSPDAIIAAMDSAIAPLMTTPVDQATLDRARTKLRSQLYQEVESFVGFGKANVLASFALFDDDPARINKLEDGFNEVTPELLMKTAQAYLKPQNRTIELIVPAAPAASTAKTGAGQNR